MKISNKIITILIASILVLLFLLVRSCQSVNELVSVNDSLNDSLITWVDENGQQNASIKVLELGKEKDFLKIQSKDKTIIWLQDVVDDYKGKLRTALVFNNQTYSNGATETILNHTDTVFIDSVMYVFPYYEASWENKWEVGKIKATRDSIFRDIKIRNKYEITMGGVSNGWFKKKEYKVNVKNLNPNTYTQELRVFDLKESPKRFSLGVQFGYGIDLLSFKPVPYLGVGVQFNLIGVK